MSVAKTWSKSKALKIATLWSAKFGVILFRIRPTRQERSRYQVTKRKDEGGVCVSVEQQLELRSTCVLPCGCDHFTVTLMQRMVHIKARESAIAQPPARLADVNVI